MSPHQAPVPTTGQVVGQGAPTPKQIAEARELLEEQLAENPIVVSARFVRTVLAGFDLLVDYVGQGQQRAEHRSNSRIGAMMHALGVTEVTITQADIEALRERGADLRLSGDDQALTLRLVYRGEPVVDAGSNAVVEGDDVSDAAA